MLKLVLQQHTVMDHVALVYVKTSCTLTRTKTRAKSLIDILNLRARKQSETRPVRGM
jgi:hypothetical protein